jgi:hypothetical protein
MSVIDRGWNGRRRTSEELCCRVACHTTKNDFQPNGFAGFGKIAVGPDREI